MEVESKTNAVRSLKYIRDTLKIDPEMIVHDFSPNLIAATTEVFGYEKIGLDPFHVMQLLNRAIHKDLSKFKETHFLDEKKELFGLRNYVSEIQKLLSPENTLRNDEIPEIPPNTCKSSVLSICIEFIKQVLFFLTIENVDVFFFKLKEFITRCKDPKNLNMLSFALAIEDKLPKRKFTKKGQARMRGELLKKLKTFFHDYRVPLEEEQKKFNKLRWALFFQPEKLTEKRKELLETLLALYPSLTPYRELTLRFGSIYRLPLDEVSESIVLDTEIKDEYGDDLKACLNTCKKHVKCILRFRDFFQKNPDQPKRCRANMEYQNTGVKKIFTSGNNLKSMGRIEGELQLHLGGEVRNFMEVL